MNYDPSSRPHDFHMRITGSLDNGPAAFRPAQGEGSPDDIGRVRITEEESRRRRSEAPPERHFRTPEDAESYNYYRYPDARRADENAASNNIDSEYTTGQKVGGLLVAAGFLAGAALFANTLSGEDDSHAPEKKFSASPMEARSAEMFAFARDLTLGDDQEKIDQAAQRIPGIAAGNAKLEALLHKAVNQKRAHEITDNQYTAVDKRIPSASITDIPLRKVVDTTMYTFDVKKVLDSAGTDPITAKDKVAQTPVPEGAEQIKADALYAVEQKQAENAIQYYIHGPAAKQKLDKEIAKITDPEVKKNVIYAADQLIAADTLRDLASNDKTADEARTATADIADPALRDRVLGSIDAHDPAEIYNPDLWTEAQKIEIEGYGFKEEHLRKGPFTEDQAAANKTKNDLFYASMQASKDAEAAYGKVVAETIAVDAPLSGQKLEAAPDAYEQIELKGIEPTQEIADPSGIIDPDRESNVHHQFAEVRVKDGQPVVAFQESGVPDKVQQQIRESMKRVDPMLRAAFASGNLTVVRFTLKDGDFSPYYSNATREMVMQLDPRDSLTADQLDSVSNHELNHGIMRNYFRGVEVSAEEHKALATACLDLQKTAYSSIETMLDYSPELLQNLRAEALPEHRAIIDTMIQSVRNKSLAADLVTDFTSYDSTSFNLCNYAGNPYGLLIDSKNKTESAKKVTNADLTYLTKTKAYLAFFEKVHARLEYASVFDDVINESGYAKTTSYVKHSLGHGEDNANEMYASIMNAAMRNETELLEGLTKLPDNEREAVRQALRVALSAAMKRAPSLEPAYKYTWNRFSL